MITIAIALGLCEFTMASEVANAFTENEVVPDAVDVAPQDEIKVRTMKMINSIDDLKFQFRLRIRTVFRPLWETN